MFKKRILFLASGILLTATSCKKEKTPGGGDGTVGEGRYIVSVLPTAAGSEGVADYLLTATSLEEGMITTEGNGVEQDGTYRYYTTAGSKFFSMLYGQGNPGAVTVYELDDKGKLQLLTNFQTETVQAFAAVNDDILMIKNSRSIDAPTSYWYQVSTQSLMITNSGQFDSKALANNGELAHFSWITQVGNKVFAPYFSIKASDAGGWSTDFPDSAWIAVYAYPDMQLEKVIKDNRTSSIGLYFIDGLAKTESGDVYAFSPANTIKLTTDGQAFNGTKPSAITRINSGTTEFDQSYYFDVEAAANGYTISSWIYVGNNIVVASMSAPADKSQWGGASKLAVINLATKSFSWVSGLPAPESITFVTTTNYSPLDGKTAYIGITTNDAKSFVYQVDATTAVATKGLEVKGGEITAIQWLPAKK